MDEIDQSAQKLTRQRRKHLRFILECPVSMTFATSQTLRALETISRNVSIGGLLVRSVSAILPHTPVSFVITVHGARSVRPIHLVVNGKIVRVESNQSDATFSIAVQCETTLTQSDEYLPRQLEKVR